MKSLAGVAAAALLALSLAGCEATVRTHGYTPAPEVLSQIQIGVDTRGSVQRKIGRPAHTGPFDEQGWYYVSTQVEHYMYHEPKVIDRKVVAVTFDDRDVVASLDVFGMENGRVVDLQTRTTPTYGRQLTVVEQIFSNIGNFEGGSIFEN